MSVDLTPQERECARRFIARRERLSRHWRWQRYVIVFLALLLFGVGAWVTAVSEQSGHSVFVPPNMSDEDAMAPVSHIEVQTMLLQGIVAWNAYLNLIVYFGAGMCMLGFTLSRWNQHLRLAIEAKLMRASLDLGPESGSSEQTTRGGEEERPFT